MIVLAMSHDDIVLLLQFSASSLSLIFEEASDQTIRLLSGPGQEGLLSKLQHEGQETAQKRPQRNASEYTTPVVML